MSAKILCKSALLVPTQIFLPDKILKMGYISNYICEPVNRFFIVVSKNQQDSKKHQISYLEYIYDNVKYSWIGDAILSSIAKVKIKTSVASYIQEFNINQYIDNLFNGVGYLFNTSDESAFYKISTFIGNNIGITLNCYFLVVPTWIIQDVVSEVYKELFYSDQYEGLNFIEQCPRVEFLEIY